MDDELVLKMLEAAKKKIKNIETNDKNTIIEFEDGERVTLLGGKGMTGPIKKMSYCSYCGTERTSKKPMISPDDNDKILICPDCAVKAVEMFVKSGVEIEMDVSFLSSTFNKNKIL